MCNRLFSRLRPDLESSPPGDASVIYFVDGSCFRDHLGNHADYAVVQRSLNGSFVKVKSEIPQPCSDQLAELKASTVACKLGKDRMVEIYTDSAYTEKNA